MEQITTTEMLTHFPAILCKIANGEHLLITEESGKPVAELSPPHIAISAERAEEESLLDKIMTFRSRHPMKSSIEEIIAWKNEGRE